MKSRCWFCYNELKSNKHFCLGKKLWINNLKDSGKIIYPKDRFRILKRLIIYNIVAKMENIRLKNGVFENKKHNWPRVVNK